MGLNVLRDAVFSVIPGGADDGTFTGSTPLVIKVDTVTISQNSTLEDHSTAQDATPLNRITKIDWEVTVETKMSRAGATGVENTIAVNELIGFEAIQAGSTTLDLECPKGIVSSVEFAYAGPNTLRFTLKPYGDPLTISFTAT
jgi:hypothetical protein